MRSGLFTALSISLLVPSLAFAQSLGGLGDISPFTISVTPQYPAPYSTATLSFLSTSLDLANATLNVSVGGKSFYQGSAQPVAVTLGKAGSAADIVATLSVGDREYTQSVSIRPQDVAIIAEPIASAPPLYPGKSAVPLEGDVRVVAVASLRGAGGAALSPNALSYAWTVDDTRIANSSGIGKTAIIVASPMQYRTRNVSVIVTSSDGSLVGGASLALTPANPSVRIYENDPLLGIRFDRALRGTFSITGSESTLYAAPFALPTTGGAPLIRWFLNGGAAQTGNSITLRPSGSGQGSASLSLTAGAGQYAAAVADLSLIFGEKPSSNFFGL
jgi:hypothetical protein